MCKQYFKIRAGHVSHKNVPSLSTLFVIGNHYFIADYIIAVVMCSNA